MPALLYHTLLLSICYFLLLSPYMCKERKNEWKWHLFLGPVLKRYYTVAWSGDASPLIRARPTAMDTYWALYCYLLLVQTFSLRTWQRKVFQHQPPLDMSRDRMMSLGSIHLWPSPPNNEAPWNTFLILQKSVTTMKGLVSCVCPPSQMSPVLLCKHVSPCLAPSCTCLSTSRFGVLHLGNVYNSVRPVESNPHILITSYSLGAEN